MDDRIKKIGIPLILMFIFNFSAFLISGNTNPKGFTTRMGIFIISGLLFGPYGAAGATIGNILSDGLINHHLPLTLMDGIVGGIVSYFAYRIWYGKFKLRTIVNKPRFNNTTNVILFLAIILICSTLYILIERKLIILMNPHLYNSTLIIETRYFLDFINTSFMIGIIGIWISNKLDFIHVPKTSTKKVNERLYKWVEITLILSMIIIAITDYFFIPNYMTTVIEAIILISLLVICLTKPVTAKISEITFNSIPEKIMNIFLFATLIIALFGVLIASTQIVDPHIEIQPNGHEDFFVSVMTGMDLILAIFFIPSLLVLKYIEHKVFNPILSFSRIEKFIEKGNKIESKGLINVYSEYLDEDSEIGMLARSYTDLIEHTNDYIENIHEIESEKEKIRIELEIAEQIQNAILPTEGIKKENYAVYGFSKPAKKVGGDFYDYYQLDEDHVAIMIGDASGKGIPAAILSTVTHSIIREILKRERNPSKVLHLLNNQVYENNTRKTFITACIGIYNTKTEILTFSNAGHPAPLILEDGKFKSLKVDTGIALGIMPNYEFVTEKISISRKIVMYTDGITDARNYNKQYYGEERMLNFLNTHQSEKNVVDMLFDDINEFTEPEEQFDDMTLMVLNNLD